MRSNYFTRKMFLRQLAPALLAAVTLAFADMADAVVVGQRMGATGLAAVGLCIPIFMVINVIMHGFGIGGSVRYATLLADNQTEEASRLFQGVMVVALSSGAVCGIGCYLGLEQLLAILGTVPEDGELYVATYQYASIVCLCTPVFYLTYILQYFLQNDDKEAVAGWGFSIGMTVDIILNVVLVLMCDWGIRGAAVATVVGNLVTSSIFLLTISRKRSPLYPTTFSPDYRSGYQSFLAGVSSSSRYLFTMTFLIIANRCLLVMAGELGVAVLDILQNASFVVYYIYEAMARSAQPLLSTYHGEKNKEQLAVTRRIASLSGHCVAMITMGGICLLPAFICNLFGITRPEEVLLSTSALRLFCLGGLFGGANLLALSFAQSCHDEDTAFFITAMRGGVILLPVTLACAFLDVYYFWYLFPITELTTLLLTRLRATLRKKHTPPPPTVFAHTIGNDLEELTPLIQELETFCDTNDSTPLQNYYVLMAVEELCTVIMNEGFQGENGLIQITLFVLPDSIFELRIRDSAHAFNPFSLPTGQLTDDEDFDLDAIGVFAIKERAKSFSYRQYQGFNTLVVRV